MGIKRWTDRIHIDRGCRGRMSLAVVLALSVGGLVPNGLSGQNAERPFRLWLSAGMGGAYARELNADGAIGVHLAGQWDVHSVMLRATFIGDLRLTDASGRSAQESAILYGRRVTTSFGYAALSTGISAVSADGVGGGSTETRTTIGLPIVAEAALQTTPVGLGAQLFGNLNSVTPFGGILVMLYFGWMP